jgi:putative ABC transport system permease protein
MKLRDLLSVSNQSLQRTRGRTILSMLGVVIGITSVILVLSIGKAAQAYIENQISSLGSDLIFVESGQPLDKGGTASPIVKEVVKDKDYKDIKRQPWVEHSVAIILKNDEATANGQTTSISVWGTDADEAALYDMSMDVGVFLSSDDINSKSRVAVLGSTISNKLFGFDNPIGRSVKINNISFRIIGVAEKTGTRMMQDMDKTIYLPYTAVMDMYGMDTIMEIIVKPTISPDEAKYRIEDIVRANHRIDNPDKDDFRTFTQEETIAIMGQITGVLQLFLTAVAAISLIVGGIGIMNIMYVSVTERTREIGLRKSLGAKQGDIRSQFMTEALFLTTTGGLIGTALGITLTWIAIQIISYYQSGWNFILSVDGILWGVGVSMGTGLFFGYFPAKRAAKLSPIEALRYE